MLIFFLLILFGLPLFLTVANITKLIYIFLNKSMSQKFVNITDFLTMSCGIIFSIVLLIILNFRDYTEPVLLSIDMVSLHSPVASWHSPTIFSLFIIGIIGYTFLRLKKTTLPPLQTVLMFSFMFIGIFISSLWIIQLSNNFTDSLIVCLILFPLNFIISSLILMKKIIEDYIFDSSNVQNQYKNKLLYYTYNLLVKTRNWIGIAIALMLPILTISMLILILFGQKPDAIIKAFTETSDWVLSKKASPKLTNLYVISMINMATPYHVILTMLGVQTLFIL